MFALQHWGINPSDVKILNMQPNQIVAAWERGDIDAAYVWDPALAELKKSGKVLITSGDLSKLGKPTFDGIAVDRKWGEDHKDFMAKLVKAIADADQQYRRNPSQWSATSPQAAAIAKMIGGSPADVPAVAVALRVSRRSPSRRRAQWLGGGSDGPRRAGAEGHLGVPEGAEAASAQSLPDYSKFVTPRVRRSRA